MRKATTHPTRPPHHIGSGPYFEAAFSCCAQSNLYLSSVLRLLSPFLPSGSLCRRCASGDGQTEEGCLTFSVLSGPRRRADHVDRPGARRVEEVFKFFSQIDHLSIEWSGTVSSFLRQKHAILKRCETCSVCVCVCVCC